MNILLPIETINREIDYKLVLAALLAKNGHKIYIGQHDYLMTLLPDLQNGLYIGKTVIKSNSLVEEGVLFKKLKKSNFDVIYLSEEGAVFKGKDDGWKKTLAFQYDFRFFDSNDAVCDWGIFQKNFDESRTEKHEIVTTGHPRFDLYKKEWSDFYSAETNKLKKLYGDFILVNGNYSTCNHGLGLQYILSSYTGYDPKDEKSRLDRISFIKYTGIQFLSIVDLTHQLSVKFPDKTFVFRPHPSEDHEFYKTIFRGVDNIKVNHDGPVAPWILASEAIIHDGCTTAIEAYISNKPVINFKEVSNEKNDIWLPNQLGVRATTLDEVITLLQDNDDYVPTMQNKSIVNSLMYNFENDSFGKLIEVIENKLETKSEKETKHPSSFKINWEYFKSLYKAKIMYLLKPSRRKELNYHRIKFYGFDKKYISSKVNFLETKLNKKLKLNFKNKNLITIESE